jgi:hypothetical protein
MKTAIQLAAILALTSGCVTLTGTAYPTSPKVLVTWQGTAEQPWHNLELMVEAASQVIIESYPSHPEYLEFGLEVFGSNDLMTDPTVPMGYIPAIYSSDGLNHLLMGATTRICGGFLDLTCWFRVRVRQERQNIDYPDPKQTHMPHFSGPLTDVSTSAVIWEIANRMIAIREGHYPGGTGAGYEAYDQLAARIASRYVALTSTPTRPRTVEPNYRTSDTY